MLYDEPMTIREKYDKLVHMVDALYSQSRGRMEVEHEMYMFERDERRMDHWQRRNTVNHEVYKTLKTLDDYIDLLEQVPTKG